MTPKTLSSSTPEIVGFLDKPKTTARGGVYHGRFTCHDVQWTGTGSEALATFTATAEQIADAAENRILWTDQDVQRGIQPGLDHPAARELPVADGYPDVHNYIFDEEKANDITDKLLGGEQLFLNPLVWNLRPGSFEAYWDAVKDELYLYTGRVYLPDSHHRHQAILKAVRLWQESHSAYPKFKGERQFKIELYFLKKEDEGNYFFDKNQRPKPVALSKAFDLTTQDDLSLLAKRTAERSKALQNNVNRVTDRLTARNPQVITLSTLRGMMKEIAPSDVLEEPELEGLAAVAAQFYDLLATKRPELGDLPGEKRRAVRGALVVDAAVMMYGYAALIKEFNADLATAGVRRATADWSKRLDRLTQAHIYKFKSWTGDLFSKANPLWQHVGVVKPGKNEQHLTVLNTGAARSECGRVLRQFLQLSQVPKNIEFLAKR